MDLLEDSTDTSKKRQNSTETILKDIEKKFPAATSNP
jgi:hypothetical protein